MVSAVTERAALGQRLFEALDGRRVIVAAAMSHAELNQRVAGLGAIAARTRGIDDDANVGDGAFGVAGLSARPAALLAQIDGGALRQ